MLAICTGMIRSGSTLQYNFARLIATQNTTGCAHGYFDQKRFRAEKRLIERWIQDSEIHVIKTHDFNDSIMKNPSRSIRLLYIYRDVRDVAVSVKSKFGREGNELIASLDSAIELYNRIISVPGILCQRYEDVVTDPSTAIAEQAEFLNIPVDDYAIARIANECSMESAIDTSANLSNSFRSKISDLLSTLGLRRHSYDDTTLLHAGHISKSRGAVGVWKSELTEYELDTINTRYSSWLIGNKYA